MKEKNPMWMTGAKEKMLTSLKEIGHKPKKQGGNGREMPEPQKKLASYLGWDTEVVVLTGSCRALMNLPNCYKVDVANKELMIAIEIDGPSHYSLKVRQADAKKQAFLEKQGWTVLRFTNKEILLNFQECAQTITSTISKLKKTTHTLQMKF
jgi:hypothetical protein